MGGIHGIGQILENMCPIRTSKNNNVLRWIRIALVFVFCSFAWIFFVSNSISDANYVISHMFCSISNPIVYFHDGFTNIGMQKPAFAIEICMLLIMFIYDFCSLKMDVIKKISEKNIVLRWGVYLGMGLILIFFSQKGVAAEFVYFQF